MRIQLLLAATITFAAIADLPGQGRGRRGRRTIAPPPAPPAAEKVEKKKADEPKKYTAIVGGDVYLGTGQRLTGATVLIADDKIEQVGHNLDLPEGTTEIDAKGKTVSPGFVAVAGSGMGASRRPPFKDGANPYDPQMKQGLAAGITSFLAGGAGNGKLPTGSNAIAKLAWGDVEGMVMAENRVAGIDVPLSLGDFGKLRQQVEAAQKYLSELEEFPAKQAKDSKAKAPKMPRGADKVVAILKGETRLWVNVGGSPMSMFLRMRGGARFTANDVDAIRQGLEISKLFGQGVVLNNPISAWLVPDEIAATGSMVILNPRNRMAADPKKPDTTGTNIASAAILAEAGVPVAVTSPGGRFGGANVGTGGILGQDLNTPHVDAAYAIRGGLDNRKALRTLTLDAARILGADARIGSIEAGKDADILILDGDPLHYATFVETALVNGKVVYEKSKDPLFGHIER
ncbi:MAG: amidohydrolase family protein [bacterium]|nr:amidohydrolase family protein [bacterium]